MHIALANISIPLISYWDTIQTIKILANQISFQSQGGISIACKAKAEIAE